MLERIALAAVLTAVLTSSASATTLTYLFSGRVDAVVTYPGVPARFAPGGVWTALLTIDFDTPEDPSTIGTPEYGRYRGAVVSASFSIGTAAGGSSLLLDIENDHGNVADGFQVFGDFRNLSGDFAGASLIEVHLKLIDTDQTVFSSDAIQVPSDATAFEMNEFSMTFGNYAEPDEVSILGHVTSIQLVPEPSAAALVAMTVLVAGGARRLHSRATASGSRAR